MKCPVINIIKELPIMHHSLENSKVSTHVSFIVLKHVYCYKIWDACCERKSNFNTLLSRLLLLALSPLEQRRKFVGTILC